MADLLAPHTEYHRGGTICAKGQMLGDAMHGHWEWYRTDGTLKRSGHFDRGQQTGEWTTFDRDGQPYKVTTITPKAGE